MSDSDEASVHVPVRRALLSNQIMAKAVNAEVTLAQQTPRHEAAAGAAAPQAAAAAPYTSIAVRDASGHSPVLKLPVPDLLAQGWAAREHHKSAVLRKTCEQLAKIDHYAWLYFIGGKYHPELPSVHDQLKAVDAGEASDQQISVSQLKAAF